MADATITAEDFTTVYDDDHTFPFFEDEDANITGFGHQDKATFAAEVNRYDDTTDPQTVPAERWTGDDVSHRWVVMNPERGWLRATVDGQPVTASTPGAIPVTTLWGQR